MQASGILACLNSSGCVFETVGMPGRKLTYFDCREEVHGHSQEA